MTDGLNKDELIEQFKGNKILKYSTYAVGAVVAIGLIFLGYRNFISIPKNEQSKAAVATGIMWMEKDSVALAIEEFEYVAGKFKGYDGAHIANYSLGNLYFQQGRFEDAIQVLNRVKIDDTYLMSLALGTIGDSYSELGEYAQAVNFYERAAQRVENELTTPKFLFKAGLNAEEAGDFAAAANFYQTIQDRFTVFANQKQIEKYVTRAKAKS
ncbi:MAG: tetratricopeptide repeat protein [Crocinitomicaceae bacterium]|nr:tetratricopeptide repeat protein [Crocinitomicaceae bacterium]